MVLLARTYDRAAQGFLQGQGPTGTVTHLPAALTASLKRASLRSLAASRPLRLAALALDAGRVTSLPVAVY